MRGILNAAVVVLCGTSSALALSDEQTNVLSHIGQVMAGAQLCPKAEANEGTLALLLVTYGLDLGSPDVAKRVKSKVRETVAAWRGKDEDAACVAVMMLYGPDGANVPDLMRWK